MQGFELNQRELQLQRIIKAQQAKITELEAKLAEGSNLEKLRLEATVKELTLKFQHKEKEVLQLRDEQSRYRQDLRESRENMRASHLHQQQRDTILNDNRSLASKVRELEDRIRSETERNESDYTRVMRLNQTLQRELTASRQNIVSIELQIEKLQIFYRSAVAELPKRVDTLQWVDNFIKFMGQYEQNLQRNPFELGFDKLEKELLELKKEFGGRVREFEESSQHRHQDLSKIKEEIAGLVARCAKQCKEAIEENEQFWEAAKKEKVTRVSDMEKKHEEELAQCKEQSRRDQQSLSVKNKQLEQQKKELTLAFQELKSYFAAREKSLAEQVRLLKQTNDKLIELGEKREEGFQNEVAKLSAEVGQLSRKYEQNIRMPFEEFNRRFAADIRSAVNEVSTFPYKERCGHLLTRMENRCRETENIIRKFAQRQASSQETMERHLDHIVSLERNLEKNIRFIVEAVERYGYGQDTDVSADFLQEQLSYEVRTNRLELSELEERKDYEIGLLKRNNSKLQEVNARLQQLLDRQAKQPGKHDRDTASTVLLSSKLEQAEADLQQLKELNNRYQTKFQQDLRKLRFGKYDRQVVNVIAENLSKYETAVHELRDYCHTIILPAVLSQNQHATEYLLDVKTSIEETREFIEQPIKRLQEVINVKETVQVVPLQVATVLRTHEANEINVSLKEEIGQLRQLLTERQKSKQSVTRVLTEVVQLLRNALPQKQHTPVKDTEEINQRKPKPESIVDRRIRELQQARLKQKNDVAAAIDKLTKAVRKAETSTSRTDHCLEVLNRSEQFLKEKVEYMVGLLEYPLKGRNVSSQFNQVSKKVIVDLESKLKESVCENEGLVRQLRLQTNFNQSFRQPRREESSPQRQ